MTDSGATHRPSVITGVEDVDVLRAAALAEAGAMLLDVREDNEWADGHIPGAVHLPLSQVTDADVSMFADCEVVVVICRSGNRSSRAAVGLAARGVPVVNVVDGMTAWAAAGLPVVTDADEPGR